MGVAFVINFLGDQPEFVVGVIRRVATTVGGLTAVVVRVPLKAVIVDALVAPGA